MTAKIKIGIIGCSNIAKISTIPAILKSENSELGHIGSRSEEKAKEFANMFGCKNYGSYDDVLKNESIDAVYISTPIGNHEKWALKAAQAGKHILCEKSSTTSYSSAKKIVTECKNNNVRIMEGFMFRFHPAHTKIKEIINKETIGKLFSFSSRYGFPPIEKNNIRFVKSLGGGILNDAGCYSINASRMLFNSEPKEVLCDLVMNKKLDVDTKATILMKFDNDRFSQSTVGYDMFYQSVYSLWGNKGYLSLSRAYNVPTDLNVTLNIQTENFNEKMLIKKVDQFKLMINSFSNEILKPNSSWFDFEKDLLNQAKVMEASRISNNEKRFVKIEEIKK